MKTTPLLLVGSLIANAVLATALLTRSSDDPHPSTFSATKTSSIKASQGTGNTSALQAALASGDPAAMAAAGVPPDLIKFISIGRNFEAASTKRPTARRSPDPLLY